MSQLGVAKVVHGYVFECAEHDKKGPGRICKGHVLAIVVLVYNSGPRVTTAFLTILPCDPEVQGQGPFKIFQNLAH